MTAEKARGRAKSWATTGRRPSEAGQMLASFIYQEPQGIFRVGVTLCAGRSNREAVLRVVRLVSRQQHQSERGGGAWFTCRRIPASPPRAHQRMGRPELGEDFNPTGVCNCPDLGVWPRTLQFPMCPEPRSVHFCIPMVYLWIRNLDTWICAY